MLFSSSKKHNLQTIVCDHGHLWKVWKAHDFGYAQLKTT